MQVGWSDRRRVELNRDGWTHCETEGQTDRGGGERGAGHPDGPAERAP